MGNPITVLSMTETAGGKAVQSELHRVSAPAASQVKTLGFADSGNGTLEIRAQPKLSFSYAIKEQDGLRCYALTANGRPRLTLHLFSGKDGALCALISNDKDGNAYLLTFTAQPGEGGSVTMKTVKEAGTEKQMRLDISAEKGALSIREI
jgi:hypothetical protein